MPTTDQILQEMAASFRHKVPDNFALPVQIEIGTSQQPWHVIVEPGKQVRVESGPSEKAKITLFMEAETLHAIYEGKMTALTAAGRARASDPAPLDFALGKEVELTPDLRAQLFTFLQHFFNPTLPEHVLLGEQHARLVHGGHAIPLYYHPGFRSAWYQVKKGERLNEPGDTNPFPQAFIFIAGEGFARIGNQTVPVCAGEAYYIPPGWDHVVWTEGDEPLTLIFLAWGRGHDGEMNTMKGTSHIVFGLALSTLSATLLTLAFPPYDLWPLIWVGLIPLLIAQHRVMPPRLSGLALGVGVGGFFWGYFGDMFAGGPWFMRALPLFIGLGAALVGRRERAFHRRTGYRWFVLHGALTWVGIEMLRGFIPVIGTWGFVGYALYEQPWLIQPVSVFGIYGLDLLILLVNYALALGALALLDRRFAPGAGAIAPALGFRWLTCVALALVAWIGTSLFLLRAPPPDLRLAALQPGFRVGSDAGLERLYDLTRRAADRSAQLIVWPEGALPFDPQATRSADGSPALTTGLRALAAETGATLVIGYAVQTEAGLRNEVTALTPAGEFLGVYGKDHPVAFAGETSLTRGTYPVYETTLGRIGTIICYDLDFTDTARKVARNGAQIIAVPSFDWSAVAAKHYSHLVFRAVENRVAMVKADVAFDSAIIDPYGRILRRTVSTEPHDALLLADLPLGAADAPAIRRGDWVGWLCLMGMAVSGVCMVKAKKAR